MSEESTDPPGHLGAPLLGGGGGVRAVRGLLEAETGPGQLQEAGAGVTRREHRGRPSVALGQPGLHRQDPVLRLPGLAAGLTAAAREAAEADRDVPLGAEIGRVLARRTGGVTNANLTGADVTSLYSGAVFE